MFKGPREPLTKWNLPALRRFAREEVNLAKVQLQRNAVYRAVVCLTIVNGARDFHTGQRLTADFLKDSSRSIEASMTSPSPRASRPGPRVSNRSSDTARPFSPP